MKKNQLFNETLCLIVETCTEFNNNAEDAPEGIWIKLFDERQNIGFVGMYQHYIKWAIEFEKKNKGRQWDGEWIDEVTEFVINKIENI